MNGTDDHIHHVIERHRGGPWDPRYAGYFDCFNGGRYFEAHEVLELLWLTKRQHADGRFYQGLIQLAGAFVHLQKGRPGPAMALLRRGREHLRQYPRLHLGLAVEDVLSLTAHWLERIQAEPAAGLDGAAPRLELARSPVAQEGAPAATSSQDVSPPAR